MDIFKKILSTHSCSGGLRCKHCNPSKYGNTKGRRSTKILMKKHARSVLKNMLRKDLD